LTDVSFESLGLEPELLRAVTEQGYCEPTPVQQEAIPLGLAGRDIVGSAQTGTGKTAAFLLPILQRIRERPRGSLRALILVPTRELAEQVLVSAKDYGRHCQAKAAAVYGGVAMGPQTRALRAGVDIIVATPGRLLDHIQRGNVNSSNLEVLVLDEADRMLDMGFAPDVNRILDTLPAVRQTMLFSATISFDVDRLARRALNKPAAVEIGKRTDTADGVEHVLVAVDKPEKWRALSRLLQELPEGGRTLVFTRTKHGADRLARQLRTEGNHVGALHGGKTQQLRTKALDRFKEGKSQILIATDVAARGIDVDDIVILRRARRSRGVHTPGRPDRTSRCAGGRADADVTRRMAADVRRRETDWDQLSARDSAWFRARHRTDAAMGAPGIGATTGTIGDGTTRRCAETVAGWIAPVTVAPEEHYRAASVLPANARPEQALE